MKQTNCKQTIYTCILNKLYEIKLWKYINDVDYWFKLKMRKWIKQIIYTPIYKY